jgi:hypothetical protein
MARSTRPRLACARSHKHVVVDGAIDGERIRKRFPDADSRQGGLVNIEGIVDCYSFLYNQKPSAWSFEVDVRTSREPW